MAGMFEYKQGNNATAGRQVQEFYYDRVGIEAANVSNVYAQFASKKFMEQNNGKKFKIDRWEHIFDRKLAAADFAKYGFLTSRSLADVTASLTAAELPEGSLERNLVEFSKTTIETSCKRYGQMIKYTDEVDLFFDQKMQARYRHELGLLANRQFEDLLQRDMLATSNLMYSGIATSLATMGTGLAANGSQDDNYRISYDLIRLAVRKLKRNRAEKHTKLVTGSVKVDTKTVGAAYYAIIGPEVHHDLEMITRKKGTLEEFVFIPVEKYAAASTMAEGEVGQVHEVKFVVSETAVVERAKGAQIPAGSYSGTLSYSIDAGVNKFDVFPVLFPCKEAFATVGIKGVDKIKFHAKSPMEDVGTHNPYGTIGFISYNFWYASIILQPEKLLRLNVLASA